jgi:Restriction endonuclease
MLRKLGCRLLDEYWQKETTHAARLFGWELVELDQAHDSLDAFIIEHRRRDGREAPGLYEAVASGKPLCLLIGGSYIADLLSTDLMDLRIPKYLELGAGHPLRSAKVEPSSEYSPRELYNWIASITPDHPVRAFTYSGDPANAVVVGHLSLRGDLLNVLLESPDELYSLSPDDFELLICDRLDAMGFAPVRVGRAFQPDGGVDIVAVPRSSPLPFVVAVQAKHRRQPGKISSGAVRDLAGIAGRSPFNMGLLVTNAEFSEDARWAARAHGSLVRLRDINDVKNWLRDQFGPGVSDQYPDAIELRPGLSVPVPWPINPS